MTELNESNFADGISKGLVLADFYTPQCGPCRAMAPLLEELQNITVVKVDVNENMGLATKFGLTAVPTLIFFKDGVEVDRMSGLQSKAVLQSKIDGLN